MTHFDNFEKIILPSNSCPIEIDRDSRGGIRAKVEDQNVDIDVRHANGDVTYRACNR